MTLLTLTDAHLAFGHVPLLDNCSFSLQSQERVGLIGRNGTGKSSLLKILAGQEKPDDGLLQWRNGLRVTYVAQEPVLDPSQTVFDAVCTGIRDVIALIHRYTHEESNWDQLQSQIEALDGWNWKQRVDETLVHLSLAPNALIGELSGGNKKRVALAIGLISKPDALLLDEPTNHLDLDAIAWLQERLNAFTGSVVIITHDRAFLDAIATRIVELDRGQLRTYLGNFSTYLLQKAEQLEQEAMIRAKADKLLSQEEAWIRQGVEARRTRAKARIERLAILRAEHAAQRGVMGRIKLDIATGATSGRLVSELSHVSKHFGLHCVVRDFSCTILRGDKVGLLGPNGAGKTTLLKLILGEISPDDDPLSHKRTHVVAGEQAYGTTRLGSNVTVAYFDQMRSALNLSLTLEDFISPGSEWIEIGKERKHVKSYLGDFLFSPLRAQSPISSLSGGERSRLLLARLFAQPANVLVLDEPTNDLDIDTIELLEELLQNYAGTVFLVSHDRTFMNNVVTSIIAAEGQGHWQEYEGGVDDWLTQRERSGALQATSYATASKKALASTKVLPEEPEKRKVAPTKTTKLSYKQHRELESLPEVIAKLEAEQACLEKKLADGSLYTSDHVKAAQLARRLAEVDDELIHAMLRLDELGSRNGL